MSTVPDQNNFYGTIETTLAKSQIVALFAADGWASRMCTWTDYELTCDVGELVLEAENPMLLHGALAEFKRDAQRVANVLREAGVSFSLECYAADGTLVAQIED